MYKIALVTQDLIAVGGYGSMTKFLYRTLSASGRYLPEVISLATSASDDSSVRLLNPNTWWKGVQIQSVERSGLSATHVGALWSEFEFQRYRPRPFLTELLDQYDLVQFVLGTPASAYTAIKVQRPVLVWTATIIWPDRTSQIRNTHSIRRLWTLLMTYLVQQYEHRALKNADFVFALSNYTVGAVQPTVGPARVTLAPYGIDTDLFCPNGCSNRNYILCVARFSDPRKNVGLLLQAYAMLKHKTDLPPLYLIGVLPSVAIQEYVNKLGIADRIHWIGVKNQTELAEYYRNAMFFVLSSDEEGLGIVILEAMASGLPVVSTQCGGPETMVCNGETGILTPVGDSHALAEAMQHLIDKPELRQKMGLAGREVAVKRFSLVTTGKIFLDKYDEILEAR